MNRFIKTAKSWDGQTSAPLLDADPAWSRLADRSGRTGLHYVSAHDVRQVDDAPDGTGNTALHLTIAKGSTARDTEFLIANGADPSRRNADGEDAFQLAERLRRRGILKMLRRTG